MKTKLYKTYARAAKVSTAEAVFVEGTDEQVFASRSEIYDTDIDVTERAFSWSPASKRVLRVFKLRNGDYGFRWYDGSINETVADRVFGSREAALDFLKKSADRYVVDGERFGWKEVTQA